MTSLATSGSTLSFPKRSLYYPLPDLSLYQADFGPGVNFQDVDFFTASQCKPAGLKLAGNACTSYGRSRDCTANIS